MTSSPLDAAAHAFAVELTQWRQERGLSKKQLAAQMGFDPSYVSHVEGHRHRPTEDFAKRAEAVLRSGGALWSRFAEYDELRHAMKGGGAVPLDQWMPPGTGLVVEQEDSSLSYVDGLYRVTVRRALYNVGPEPVTRYPIRIAVDKFPTDPQLSNEFYRRHPLTFEELGLTALWGGVEPMTCSPIHDRDSFKEVWLHFSNDQTRFPLYRGERAVIEYSHQLSEEKWGCWFQRTVRLPTWHLGVRLDFPAVLRPTVSGLQTSLTAEAPLATPIRSRTVTDPELGERAVFEWSTENPPLHARYRLDWNFRPAHVPAQRPLPERSLGPAAQMVAAGVLQRDHPLLRQRARRLDLPAQRDTAQSVIDRLHEALRRISRLHTFGKGVGLAAPQLAQGWAVAVVHSAEPGTEPIVLLNPVVVGESTERDERYEGCLSFFDVRGAVSRPLHIEVEHVTLDGEQVTSVFERAQARLVLHEIDHLQGWLYDDRMEPDAELVPVSEYLDSGNAWNYP